MLKISYYIIYFGDAAACACDRPPGEE